MIRIFLAILLSMWAISPLRADGIVVMGAAEYGVPPKARTFCAKKEYARWCYHASADEPAFVSEAWVRKRLLDITDVMRTVHARIDPTEDVGEDVWTPSCDALHRKGDCDEYALCFLELLRQKGFPRSALSFGRVPHHNVAIIRVKGGRDIVLDNMFRDWMYVDEWARIGKYSLQLITVRDLWHWEWARFAHPAELASKGGGQ